MHHHLMAVSGIARGCTRLCSRPWVVSYERLQTLYAVCSTLSLRPGPALLASPLRGQLVLAPKQRPAATLCQAYANPEVYDIAFSFRSFEQEAAYLLDAYQERCSGPLERMVEIGCGPARHSILLAKSAGCSGLAVDISQDMLEYAAQKAVAEGVADRLTFAQADMTTPFADGLLQSTSGAVADLALILLGTLAHCLTNEAAVNCFQQVARLVRPGGLLVLELPHPEEMFSGSFYKADEFVDAWDASAGNKTVLVEWGREGDDFDSETQILDRTVGMTLYEGQELISSQVQAVKQRHFTFQEVKLLGRLSGFHVVAVHGDFNKEISLSHEDAYRMIVCLRRG